jgi:hypothetical protein
MDNCAGANFISKTWCDKNGLTIRPIPGSAELPDGTFMHSCGQTKGVVAIQELRVFTHFTVLDPSTAYEVILGQNILTALVSLSC